LDVSPQLFTLPYAKCLFLRTLSQKPGTCRLRSFWLLPWWASTGCKRLTCMRSPTTIASTATRTPRCCCR